MIDPFKVRKTRKKTKAVKPAKTAVKITRNSVWKTQHGEKIKFKDMPDLQITNLLQWLPTSFLRHQPDRLRAITDVLMKEVYRRNLPPELLTVGQVPYKAKNGRWYINRGDILSEELT